jgi:hypothetical protein
LAVDFEWSGSSFDFAKNDGIDFFSTERTFFCFHAPWFKVVDFWRDYVASVRERKKCAIFLKKTHPIRNAKNA